jgi:cytochrome c oxidase subunit 2
MKKIVIILLLVIFGTALWFVFIKQKPEEKEDVSQQENMAVGNLTKNLEDKQGEKIKEFKVVAKRFTYEPKTIKVNKGDKVILKIKSIDVPHSFTLPDFGVKARGGINEFLAVDEEKTVEFVADKQGEFVFGCDVVCGEGHTKMLGKLIVE